MAAARVQQTGAAMPVAKQDQVFAPARVLFWGYRRPHQQGGPGSRERRKSSPIGVRVLLDQIDQLTDTAARMLADEKELH